jgi:hypothetical protein
MAHLLGEQDSRGILPGRIGLKGAVAAGQSIKGKPAKASYSIIRVRRKRPAESLAGNATPPWRAVALRHNRSHA